MLSANSNLEKSRLTRRRWNHRWVINLQPFIQILVTYAPVFKSHSAKCGGGLYNQISSLIRANTLACVRVHTAPSAANL